MNRSDNPSVKLGWIVVILLFPLFGGLLYVTIGGKQPISYLRRKLEPMIEESARHLKADPEKMCIRDSANEVEKMVTEFDDLDIKVAVMGCVVNGPGEAKEADIGIAGGKGEGLLLSLIHI